MKPYVPEFKVQDEQVVRITVCVEQNWFFKNGKLKKQDVSNMLKVLIDLVAEKQGWDDARVWEVRMEKMQAEVCERAYVTVEVGDLSETKTIASIA